MSARPRRTVDPILGMVNQLQQTIKNASGKNMNTAQIESLKLKLQATKSNNDRRTIITNTLEKYKRTPAPATAKKLPRTPAPATASKRQRTAAPATASKRQRTAAPMTANKRPKTNVMTGTKNTTRNAIIARRRGVVEDGLTHLYTKIASAPQVTGLVKGKTREEFNDLVDRQIDHLKKRSITSPIPNNSYTFETDSDFDIDFMFLTWLDTRHDKTTKASFASFLKSSFVKILYGGPVAFRKTAMINKILEIYKNPPSKANTAPYKFFIVKPKDISMTGTSNWEAFLKRNLHTIFGIKKPGYTIQVDRFKPDIFKHEGTNLASNNTVIVGIDQEDNNRKTISSALLRTTNRTDTEKKFKILQPHISVANMLDPGNAMPLEGVKSDITGIMTNTPHSRISWNFVPMEFKVGKLRVKTLFDATTGMYALKVNDVNITPSVSAKSAQTSSNPGDKISKFMGDFLQVLYLSSLSAYSSSVALGTGDGMMTVLYSFMMTRCIGKDPKMIIDLSKDNKLQLMGFDNLLVTSKLQQVNMSNQTTVMQPGDLGGFVNGTKNDAKSNTGATMGNNNQRSPSALTSTTVRRIPNQPTMMNRFLNNQSRRR
tara:strand:+ start:1389 stop:3188 length:1800 start_codon:yes stop_codon:yes gene_type:complete